MNFTASSFERMMKQKPRPQAPARPNRPEAPPAPAVPTGGACAVSAVIRNFLPGRAAGGDALARELTREEKAAIRSLVVKWCANYDRACGCLPLDCECYMLGKCWTGAYCRYFREAVLPLDPALEPPLLLWAPGRIQALPHLRRGRGPGQAAGVLFRGLRLKSPPPPTAGIYAPETGVIC